MTAALTILPVVALVAAVVGLTTTASLPARGVCVVVATACVLALGLLFRQAMRPRLARHGDQLAVFLTGSQPILVPLVFVECFFLGQGPSLLPWPASGPGRSGLETATLIVRLAESADGWQHRDVNVRWGQWCEGYITIRGTGCEPLHGALVARLNERLVAVHRAIRQAESKVAV